jgi:hypothetical protein
MYSYELHLSSNDQWLQFVKALDGQLVKIVESYKGAKPDALGAHFIANVAADEFFTNPQGVAERIGKWILGKRGSSALSGVASVFRDDVRLAHRVRWGSNDMGTTGDISSFGSLLSALIGLNVTYVLHEKMSVSAITMLNRTLNVGDVSFTGWRTPLPLNKDSDYVRAAGDNPASALVNWLAHRFAVSILRPALAGSTVDFEVALRRLYPHGAVSLNHSIAWRDEEADFLRASRQSYFGEPFANRKMGLVRTGTSSYRVCSFAEALFNLPDLLKQSAPPDEATDRFEWIAHSKQKEIAAKNAEYKKGLDEVKDVVCYLRGLSWPLMPDVAGLAAVDTAAEIYMRRLAASAFLGRPVKTEEWQAEFFAVRTFAVAEVLAGWDLIPERPFQSWSLTEGDPGMAVQRYYDGGHYEGTHTSVYVSEGEPLFDEDCSSPLAPKNQVIIQAGSARYSMRFGSASLRDVIAGKEGLEKLREEVLEAFGSPAGLDPSDIDEGISLTYITSEVM